MKPKKLVLEIRVDEKGVRISARMRPGRAVAIPLGIEHDGEGAVQELKTQTPRLSPNTTPTKKH